ncbi:MAG: nitronate monooxygenase [Gemmobacter sp.]|nr:nitronate monooxygenase [Gemmobacter sp.]
MDRKIPIIAAGGIFYGYDARPVLEAGASGVQMATRFVTTEECDAHINFKMQYHNCGSEDDLKISLSPVGMLARLIENDFSQRGCG